MTPQSQTLLDTPGVGASSSPAFLSLRGLTKRYDKTIVVNGLDLDVAQGELLGFLGPSGCGKTTCLRMIAGLTPTTSGTIAVNGRDLTHVPTHERDMGVVFQSYALFPHMNVSKNVAFGLEMRKVSGSEAEKRVEEAIAMVRLAGRQNHKPAQLSGGQQQRVALARALVVRPSILLLDEPLSNLDAKLRDEMRTEIRDIQQRLGITAIFVTHDQGEALTMCDKIAVMYQGKLEQLGTPADLYERPKTPFVASFVGRSNQMTGVADNGSIRTAGGTLRADTKLSGPVTVMVRPHRITVQAGDKPQTGDSLNQISGTIARIIYAGDILQYEVLAAGTTLLVEQTTRSDGQVLQQGTTVTLAWQIADTMVFEASA